jgi:Ca-activated chloride channel family protein
VTKFASTAFVAALFLIFVEGVNPQNQPSIGRDPSSPFQISVNLNLVVLPVTVRDRKGGFASDLREQDFEVYEDGVLQSVRLFRHEDIPVTVGLVVDHSGSMQRKLTDVLAAAQAFVALSNPDDQMFVVNFNERVTLGLPPTIPFTNRPDQMEAAILEAPVTGQTALYDALGEALDRLRAGNREKKVLIVISDGGDNASALTMPQILKKAGESNAILYTIGIFEPDDPDQNAGVLRRLAKETGGDAYFPGHFSEAVVICQDIAKDIRHQYTIGYVSGSAKAGGHRAVRVVARVAGKDLAVRTRAGYVADETQAKNEAAR